MKKIIIGILFALLISGCGSDRLAFSNRVEVNLLGGDLLCIKSRQGDVVIFYSLSSSENNYSPAILQEDGISKKYPDTCVRVKLKNDVSYEFIYTMNKINYRSEFRLVNNKLQQK